ncbi:MAG: GNAT family N-acetyltransferase [Nannocystis sp.]|nr:GNAT family protein [Nannocystis sp.]MBK9753005.1 GNAT family N-acetyltransferase [Nannocystis sp.]
MIEPTTLRVTLRAVDLADEREVATLIAFVNANYRSPFPIDAELVRDRLHRFFWAHDDAGARVGSAAYVRKTAFLAESIKTVVDPAHRQRGVGAAISRAIEAEIRRAGFTKAMSTIYIDNIPMIVIKLRQGYIIEGLHRDHEQPGLHEYSLGKLLTQ